MRYLTKQQLIRLNEATIQNHGGHFMPPNNFLHEENLDYLIEAVQAEMFGEPLYPTIADKAAVYCYNTICNHIFSDGSCQD
jgi:death-on-curing protein